MQFIGHLIIRLIAIFFGVTLAVLAAGIFISFGMFSGMFEQLFADIEYVFDQDIGNTNPLVSLLVIGVGILSSFTVASLITIPAFVAIALAEGMRWSGLTINLVLGGVVSLFAGITAIPVVSNGVQNTNLPSQGTLTVLLATGFIAGFVYWLIAGRNAGKWLGDEQPAKQELHQELNIEE